MRGYNRLSFSQNIGGIGKNTTPTIDNATNRFEAGQGFVYDKNGNITNDLSDSSQNRQFVFNAEDKQTEVKDANGNPIGKYFYDGENRRVKKVTDLETTVFVYSSGKLVAEYSTKLADNPSTNYMTTDHLGTPRVITNELGQVKSRRDFMPFGEELTINVGERSQGLKYGTSDEIRQKFTGYQKDTETQLDFAEARMYENRHARFTAVDPLLASGRSPKPQTFNRYVYVGNNPIIKTDPTGLIEWVYDSTAPKGIKRPTWISHEEFEKGGYTEWEKTTYETPDGIVTLDRSGPINVEGAGTYSGWTLNGIVQGTGVFSRGYDVLKNRNTVFGFASTMASSSFVLPEVPTFEPITRWTGKNGQTFSLFENPLFYGNQYTGSRSVAIALEEASRETKTLESLNSLSRANRNLKFVKGLGWISLGATQFFAVQDFRTAKSRGDAPGQVKAIADGTMGIVSIFPPIGTTAGAFYFGSDFIRQVPDPGRAAHKRARKFLLNKLGPENE